MTLNLHHYEIHPNLTKQDTLFVHGNLASSIWWRPTLDQWREMGGLGHGRFILADGRGSGRNPEWSALEPFTLEQLALDYLELLDHLHVRDVALVGHSLGGLVCLQMMILAPERIAKAVLLDPVGVRGVVFDAQMYEAFRRMAESPDLTRAVILGTIRGAETLSQDFVDHIAGDAYKAVRGIGKAVLEILKSVDLRSEIQQVQTPTLILHGVHDRVIPLDDSRQLHDLHSRSRLELLHDAGH
ncbi:MAG: alpha/beta fold hydrolase, partial [Bdellovibrionales bacterium]